jgi:Class II Aldolase and Adducin N-terminal domain
MKSRRPTLSESPLPSEGTIHFRYRLTPPTPGDRIDPERFARLAAWRRILRQLKLLGRDARRYDGYGYGNLSTRDPAPGARFFVTASQSSGVPHITRGHIVRVDHSDAERFEVDATGTQPPSSESITHAMLYAVDADVAWIMHVHSDAIWQAAARLRLPCTPAAVTYGSPAMADSVAQLLRRHAERPLVFATLGHVDGIFACGGDAASVGGVLVATLARALYGTAQ